MSIGHSRRAFGPPKALCLALGLSLPLAAAPALAQPRPFTPRTPCVAVAQLVYVRGAIVLSTSPTTYDRYVRDRSFCEISEVLKPAWVWSADNPQCFIGYTCIESDHFRDR
jgi:hypothetical protein